MCLHNPLRVFRKFDRDVVFASRLRAGQNNPQSRFILEIAKGGDRGRCALFNGDSKDVESGSAVCFLRETDREEDGKERRRERRALMWCGLCGVKDMLGALGVFDGIQDKNDNYEYGVGAQAPMACDHGRARRFDRLGFPLNDACSSRDSA